MKNSLQKLVRPNILQMKSYTSARDEYMSQEGVFLDANESPYGTINRYPDPNQKILKELLAQRKSVNPKNIFIGNGSDEAIDLLFRIFCNPGIDKSIGFSPSYGMYEVSAATQDIQHINIPLNTKFQIDKSATKAYLSDSKVKLLFICSPNNPTGNLIKSKDILWILDNFQGILIIDEAYIDFNDKATWISEIENYERLVILQTMSKSWGLAGARIGMAYSNPTIIALLNKIKSPYNVSTLNQKAAIKAISNSRLSEIQINAIISQRQRMEKELSKIKSILKIYPSKANFILVNIKNANQVYEALISQKVVVRNQSNKIENCLRLSIGTPEENNHLLKALSNIKELMSK